MKNVLKIAFIALLFISIVAIPLFGVHFYTSPADYQATPDNYFVLPSIFDDNAILTNIQLGGGTSVYLSYHSDDEKVNTQENLEKGAKIIETRFRDRGYNDAKAFVEDGMIRLDFAQKTYIESIVSQVASIGDWSFVGSDMTKVLCDASYIKDAYVSANGTGGYGITLEFNEKGKGEFFANTASYATSGSSFYLMIDGQFTAVASISDSTVTDTFTFGSYEYESAAIISSLIKNGKLPSEVHVEKTEALAPSLNKGILGGVAAVSAMIVVISCVLLLIKGRSAGIFAVIAVLADVAIFVISMLNSSWQLNLITLFAQLVCVILATVIALFAIIPVGKSLKEKKFISASALEKVSKFNVKSLWIHGILIVLSIICYLFAKGTFISIVRITLTFACANAIFYFLFLYFGIRILSDIKK